MINKTCPLCGGSLELQDDNISYVCEYCGEKFSLSELNNKKLLNTKSSLSENEENSEFEHKSAFKSREELIKLSDKKLVEQINLALETENWNVAKRCCNEMIRRDPTNANAYLFKLLAEVKLSKKEDLPKLNIPLDALASNYYDMDYDEDYEFDEIDEDLYKLFLKFSDSDLKHEIELYNKQIKERLEKEKQQKDLADKRLAEIRDEEYRKENKRESVKKLLKIFIPIAILVIIIIGIVCAVKNKNFRNDELYRSTNFDVKVTNKTNVEYDSYSNCYTYAFKFGVTNNSKKGITYFVGFMTIKETNNNSLLQCKVSLSGSLASGSSTNWNVEAYNYDKDTGLVLWDTDYEELNIFFRISEIHFSDNVVKTYDNKDVLIKSANVNYQENQYQSAISLYEQGRYSEAIEIFNSLGNYKNSNYYLQQSKVELENQIWTQKIYKIVTAQKASEVILGSYEQDNNLGNGKEDIEWLVLEKQDNKLMLISKYCLDYYQFDGNYYDGTTIWESSDLRNWLNTTFYNNTFSSKETNLISSTTITPSISEQDKGGIATNDKVYILSAEEVTNYFPNQCDRLCELTNYSYNLYNTWGITSANWWVRTPVTSYKEQFVDSDGFINSEGLAVEDVRAIRPVICIDLSAIA